MTDQSPPPRPDYSRSPYDPNPPAKTPAENGFIRCPDCETVVEAKGHECEGRFGPKMRRVWVRVPADLCPRCRRVDLQLGSDGDFYSADCVCDDPDERAEFAESMLCALAFDHIRTHADFSCPEWTQWGEDGHCAFCDAAREVKP